MPRGGAPTGPRESLLTYEEILTVVRAAAELGITSIRITGGEPLVRRDLTWLVAHIAEIPGISDLSMTTNGALLARYAQELAASGLRRVNVSLDSLRPDRFAAITCGGRLDDVMDGIRAALNAGLRPVKVNVVVMRGVNDDEVADLARLSYDGELTVRFIELMPVGPALPPRECAGLGTMGDARSLLVPAARIRAAIEALGPLEPAATDVGVGPARYWRLEGAKGLIGIISQVTEHACAACNRLRLTPDGMLRPCLMDDGEVDLRTPLRSGAGVEEIKARIVRTVEQKPEKMRAIGEIKLAGRYMSQIGG
jgi:cyclic pyranopterin phosphate synthase